jgi:hypothetical protein
MTATLIVSGNSNACSRYLNDLQIHTSTGRFYSFGYHIPLTQTEYTYRRLFSQGYDRLLYDDPEHGQPILYFGTDRPLPSEHKPSMLDIEITHAMDRPMYYSHASLEHVYSVRCFYQSDSQLCIGVLLEYRDKRRVALGQCRVAASPSVQVFGPIAMYVKRAFHESGILVQFTDGLEHPDGSGWERKEMKGEITWWFDRCTVEVVYS